MSQLQAEIEAARAAGRSVYAVLRRAGKVADKRSAAAAKAARAAYYSSLSS